MLLTLCEMQRILYQQELKRTSKNILHLYLQTFLHAMLLINNFKNPKTITKRKCLVNVIMLLLSMLVTSIG